MNFHQKLNNIVKKNNSLVCVGLDPELEKLPKHLLSKRDPISTFNKAIIDATHDLVCAYKPNIAFYEAYGIDGLKQLKKTIDYLRKHYPDIPIILDAKRGDVANTAKMYAKSIFEFWNADAVTVYPHLGLDSLIPFFSYKDKLVIILIKTSNPDAKMFQDQKINGEPYYLKMAKTIKAWRYQNIGLFVGATYPNELKLVRSLFPTTPVLTAGIGAQEAQTEKVVKAGVDKNGGNLICNNSRSIIYASKDKGSAVASRKATEEMRRTINAYRNNQTQP